MQVGGLTIKQMKVTGLQKKVKKTESLVEGPAGTTGGNSVALSV